MCWRPISALAAQKLELPCVLQSSKYHPRAQLRALPQSGHSIWGLPVPKLLAPSEASSLSTTCWGQAAFLQQLLSVVLSKQAFEHTALTNLHPQLCQPTAITGLTWS